MTPSGFAFTVPGMHSWQRPRAHLVNGKIVFFKDTKSREFEQLVARVAQLYMDRSIDGHYGVKVTAYTKSKRNRDVDRVLNGVLDGLVKSGRVSDDRYCWQQTVERRMTSDNERIEVEVYQFEPRREGVIA